MRYTVIVLGGSVRHCLGLDCSRAGSVPELARSGAGSVPEHSTQEPWSKLPNGWAILTIPYPSTMDQGPQTCDAACCDYIGLSRVVQARTLYKDTVVELPF